MERTKSNKDVIRWRKTGGGSFRMAGGKKIIKPGQVFSARLDQIPVAFRDVIIPVDGAIFIEKEKQEKIEVPEPEFKVNHRGVGWYDVLDNEGKAINDKALKKEAAWNLLKSLTD